MIMIFFVIMPKIYDSAHLHINDDFRKVNVKNMSLKIFIKFNISKVFRQNPIGFAQFSS